MRHEALAFSTSAPNERGDLLFIGKGSKAFNFLTASNQILTLHLNGYGLGPSGWLISTATFHKIQTSMPYVTTIALEQDRIDFGSWHIAKGCNGVTLSVNKTGRPTLGQLYQFMCRQKRNTGLYGPLATLAIDNPLQRFEFVWQQLQRWMGRQSPDWNSFIGKGPGLTPSHDDMLVGMLFAANLFSELRPRASQLLPDSLDLSALTTSVSTGYLQQARQGYFSQPLLEILPDHSEDFAHRACIFLHHGHYSGADTLLGIWLFFNFIFKSRAELLSEC